MKVKAVTSFAGQINGKSYQVQDGDEFELPAGADWLRCGFVVTAEPEQATVGPAEQATQPRRRRKQA